MIADSWIGESFFWIIIVFGSFLIFLLYFGFYLLEDEGWDIFFSAFSESFSFMLLIKITFLIEMIFILSFIVLLGFSICIRVSIDLYKNKYYGDYYPFLKKHFGKGTDSRDAILDKISRVLPFFKILFYLLLLVILYLIVTELFDSPNQTIRLRHE